MVNVKRIAMFIIIVLNLFCIQAYAQKSDFSVSNKIESFFLTNNPNALEEVKKVHEQSLIKEENDTIDDCLKRYQTEKIPMLLGLMYESNTLIPENAFCFYQLITPNYANQYAHNSCFDLLVSDAKLWLATVKDLHLSKCYYEENFTKSEINYRLCEIEAINFLKDTENIEQSIINEIDEKIIDCKIVECKNFGLILYLKGENTDYGIILYDARMKSYENYLERFKIYPMSEIMESYGMIDSYMYNLIGTKAYSFYGELMLQKPTYESESAALMEEGIIAGTDKGMEPLKPLSRIEATAILVRLLGLEENSTSEMSYFSDIASDNWGSKYANIAYDAGIAAGVGDNQFAPDQRITASQFVTLLMRSQNEDVDWQTAINLFVERGIITQEQADKMDLFTRGDMAKIIYEAKQKGII